MLLEGRQNTLEIRLLTEMLTHPNDEISTLDNINNQFGN
jgi:hypothetical protein